MENKQVLPFAVRGAVMKLLNETYPGQFVIKFFAEYFWWPHMSRLIWYQTKNYCNCIQAGKKLKPLTPSIDIESLPTSTEANEEIDSDFAGPLDINRDNQKYYSALIGFPNFLRRKLPRILRRNQLFKIISFDIVFPK